MATFEYILVGISVLIILSIVISKFSESLGLPSLLLFLCVGMIAGSDGLGKIYFEDVNLSQEIALIALVFILFSGGLETRIKEVRPALKSALSLSTLGVVITALVVGLGVSYFTGMSFKEGMLIGAIISSTDAAAVFSVLKGRNIRLKGKLKELLELESGSNDPMAVILTLILIQYALTSTLSVFDTILFLLLQISVGLLSGYFSGKLMSLVLKKVKFSNQGFYPVLLIAFALLVFSLTSLLKGSGILAVYLSAIILGSSEFIMKRSMLRFFDGLALLGQIIMFLTLGLLVNPSELKNVFIDGLWISLGLILAARPAGVFISLMFSKFKANEKLFVSWVGLRGAVPIILATFPLTAGLESSRYIFNLIFFITLITVLVQGWSLPAAAKFFRVTRKDAPVPKAPEELAGILKENNDLLDFIVPVNSLIAGKTLAELELPPESLITVIFRNDDYFVPSGSTAIEEGDTFLMLVNKQNAGEVKRLLSGAKKKHEN